MLQRKPPRSPFRGNEKTNDIPWRMSYVARPVEDGDHVEVTGSGVDSDDCESRRYPLDRGRVLPRWWQS